MNKRIDDFAKTIKGKNAKDARMANTLFVISLMAAAVVMLLFHYGDKGDFDVFQWENLTCLIPLISVYLFTDKYYKKYLRIDDYVLPLNLSDFMNMHALSTEEYFTYIAKKIFPFQAIMIVVFGMLSVLSENKLVNILTTLASAIVTFLTGFLKRKIYIRRLMKEGKTLGILFGVLDGVMLFIQIVLIVTVGICFSFFTFFIAETVVEEEMIKGQVLERIIGEPFLFIMFLLGIGTFFVCYYLFTKKSFLSNTILRLSLIIGLAGMIGIFISGRFWYYEINYTTEKITIVHFAEKQYDFSDVENYEWKVIEDSDVDNPLKTLVLYLCDGTVLDLNADGAYGSSQGDYEQQAQRVWPQ